MTDGATASAVDGLLIGLITGGASAAAYAMTTTSIEDMSGAVRTVLSDRIMLNEDVVALLRGATSDGHPFDFVAPLWAAAGIVNGHRLECIERPEPAMLFWQGAALVQAWTRTRQWTCGPSGILAPRRADERASLIVVTAADRRGIGGVVWANDDRSEHFVRRLTTNVPEARGRMAAIRRGLEQITRDLFKSVLAEAITEYLQRREALTGSDGAPPSHAWDITAKDRDGLIRHLAGWPGETSSRHPFTRFNGMFEAIDGTGNAELYGRRSGPHEDQPSVLSLDEPFGSSTDDDAATLGALLRSNDEFTLRLEIADAIARSGLTDRQSTVLRLHRAGLKDREIAAHLGVAHGTIAATLNQTIAKIEKASSRD